MKYPTLSLDECKRVAALLLDGQDADLANVVKWVGTSPELDVHPIEALASEVRNDLDAFIATGNRDKDAFEGAAAGKIHATLRQLPLEILDDPGFWRYLSVSHFWELVQWRESGAFAKGWDNYRPYIDARRQAECVPLRMFLRGQIALRDGGYALAAAVEKGTDLWRSHIVRVRTSYSPVLAQSLVTMQRDSRLNTDDLREIAKRVQRVSSNVVLHLYGDEDATELLDELRTGLG
jgi:hypothetical protein